MGPIGLQAVAHTKHVHQHGSSSCMVSVQQAVQQRAVNAHAQFGHEGHILSYAPMIHKHPSAHTQQTGTHSSISIALYLPQTPRCLLLLLQHTNFAGERPQRPAVLQWQVPHVLPECGGQHHMDLVSTWASTPAADVLLYTTHQHAEPHSVHMKHLRLVLNTLQQS